MPRPYQHWSAEENERLRAAYAECHSVGEVAKRLGRTKNNIYSHATFLGLKLVHSVRPSRSSLYARAFLQEDLEELDGAPAPLLPRPKVPAPPLRSLLARPSFFEHEPDIEKKLTAGR